MRFPKPRPDPIYIGQPYSPSSIGFDRLACHSPDTPSSVFGGSCPTSPLTDNTAIIEAERHTATAWSGQFNYFKHVQAEVRDKIYSNLVGYVTVVVKGDADSSVVIHKHLPYGQQRTNLPSTSMPSWFLISQEFYREARQVMWRQSGIRFERRYDFLSAALRKTDSPAPFPLGNNVLCALQDLTINLCCDSDFEGRIEVGEVRRVTMCILEYIKTSMPALKTLKLIVDERSKICSSVITFMPDAWFLAELSQINQVRSLYLIPGPTMLGCGRKQIDSRRCIEALNTVMKDHLTCKRRLDITKSARQIQAHIGQRMLSHLKRVCDRREAVHPLATKVAMLTTIYHSTAARTLLTNSICR